MRLHSLKLFFIFLFAGIWSVAGQFKVPPKPTVLYPVYDAAGMLTQQEKDELNRKLIKFEDSTSTEIAVIIIPTTNGEDVNYAATMYGEKWGIGKKETDNGVVFLIARDDRTMSIQQGRAVEQYLTASVSGQILDYIVTPHFKQGQWYEGINRGTSAIMEAVQGKFKPAAKQQSRQTGEISLFKIILIAFIIMIILRILFGNRGGGGGRYDDDDVIITRRGSRRYRGGFFPFPPVIGGGFGGGSFGGGGGGGFGGFGGGGSFGGGGASGSW